MSVSALLFRGNYSSCLVWIIMERYISPGEGGGTLPIGESESLQFIVKFTTIFISLTEWNRRFMSLLDYIIFILKKMYVKSNFRLPFIG